jgi:hypothetical protein
MNKYIASIAIAITLPVHSGFKQNKESIELKSSPEEKLGLSQIKSGSAADKSLNIEVVGRLQAGDLVTFILPDGNKVTGKVTRHDIINNTRINIVGIFLKENEAGFGFSFNKEGYIDGALLFKDKNIIYRMRFNENSQKFFLLKEIYFNKELSL